MDTLIRGLVGLVVSLGMLFGGAVMADSPVDIKTPDSHSVAVKGKVNVYRVQVEGMDLGKGKDKVHGEVFVTLDSSPDQVYSLALHDSNNGASAVNEEMARTLRTAYVNKTPVTIYRQIAMSKNNNYKILMVQLD